jgi:hypothetical protein
VLTVEKGQRILLKIRQSLRKSLEDCPGIEDELDMQPKYRSIGVKRPAEDLVSPPRKAQRKSVSKSLHASARKPPTVLNSESEVSMEPPAHQMLESYPEPKLPKEKYIQFKPLVSLQKKLVSLSASSYTAEFPLQDTRKRWPFEFKVFQIHNGFIQIRETLKKAEVHGGTGQSGHSKKDRDRKRKSISVRLYCIVRFSSQNVRRPLTIFDSYGSAGHALIISELEDMFPANSLNMPLLAPLSWGATIKEFLFPETVLLLLQEDLRISVPDILQVLREKNSSDVGCGSKVWPH